MVRGKFGKLLGIAILILAFSVGLPTMFTIFTHGREILYVFAGVMGLYLMYKLK